VLVGVHHALKTSKVMQFLLRFMSVNFLGTLLAFTLHVCRYLHHPSCPIITRDQLCGINDVLRPTALTILDVIRWFKDHVGVRATMSLAFLCFDHCLTTIKVYFVSFYFWYAVTLSFHKLFCNRNILCSQVIRGRRNNKLCSTTLYLATLK